MSGRVLRAAMVIAVAVTAGCMHERGGDSTPGARAAQATSPADVRGASLVEGANRFSRVYRASEALPSILVYERADGLPSVHVVASQLIVAAAGDVDPASARADVDRMLEDHPGVLGMVRQIPGSGIFLIEHVGLEPVGPGEVATLVSRALPAGFRYEPNLVFFAAGNQDHLGTGFQQQWALRNPGNLPDQSGSVPDADIDGYEAIVRQLRELGSNSPEVVVAVLDSGLDVHHPALRPALWRNAGEFLNGRDDDGNGHVDDLTGWDFITNSGSLVDDGGHGTNVAGVIAARPTDPAASHVAFGLAPHARILPLRVLAKRDTDDERTVAGSDAYLGTLFDVLGAHRYARDKQVDVINMSFETYVRSPLLEDEIHRSHASGIHMVAAAGNGRPNGIGVDVRHTPVFPCVVSPVVCVGSTGRDDALSTFSNRGHDPMSGAGVVIAAPGEWILTTQPWGGYTYANGTSLAAPMVAAVYAAAKALRPAETFADRQRRVLGNADRIRALAEAVDEGRRLNAYEALFTATASGASQYDQNAYCTERIIERESGQPIERWRNRPYANWGEPGIDGRSPTGAYTICSPQQLSGMRDEHLDRHFRLMQDIFWSQLSPTDPRDPIGNAAAAPGTPPRRFEGRFDGNGHAVIGLDFRGRPDGGLFAYIGERGAVTDLRLRNVDIRVSHAAGALAVKSEGHVVNVVGSGHVEGDYVAGGLVAWAWGGTLHWPFFEGMVRAKNAGGIAGNVGQGQRGYAGLRNGHFNGTVVGGSYAGGLAASVWKLSFASGHAAAIVEGQTAGGIAARLTCGAKVHGSYATGHLQSDGIAGGLVGYVSEASIGDSYASVAMEQPGHRRGGAVGEWRTDGACGSDPLPPAKLEHAYYNADLTPTPGAGGLARTSVQLSTAATFPSWWLTGNPPDAPLWSFVPGFTPARTCLPRSFDSRRHPPTEATCIAAEPESGGVQPGVTARTRTALPTPGFRPAR